MTDANKAAFKSNAGKFSKIYKLAASKAAWAADIHVTNGWD
jgi:hypothetical protein